MQHITNIFRFSYWGQQIKKWEASKIDLKSLRRCKCGTVLKYGKMCDYCIEFEEYLRKQDTQVRGKDGRFANCG